MADQKEDSQKQTIQTIGKFIIDRNESLSDSKSVSYHRNGMFQTTKTTEIFATNEPSTFECIKLPNTYYYGSIKLTGNSRHLIFTGDNKTTSEIGIADLEDCTYKKLISGNCLNFRDFNNPITGKVRLTQEGEEEVMFIDGFNSDKVINLSQIPYQFEIDEISQCKTKEYSDKLDCRALKLNPSIKFPCLTVEAKSGGNLPDGMYFVHIAYLIGEQRFTDYMSSTIPVTINNYITGTNSISVQIENLDRGFERYQLILTGVVEGITTHQIIGIYYTNQDHVTISDWVNEEYVSGVPSTEIVTKKVVYDSTGILDSNADTVFRADVKRSPTINYQQQAFNIKAKYIVKQVSLKYYKEDGRDIGYFRNEIYRFVIRWYRTNGEVTEHSIISTTPKKDDLAPASGQDKFEKEARYNYEIYNTASKLTKLIDGDLIGYGDTGFWQSTDKFPETTEIFGERACTPISDHMMPDEVKVPRFTVIGGEIFINILGVRFENIEHPLDEDSKPIEDISHYEILRSERDEANSRVISRGVLTNMGGYQNNQKREILYGNFPYNDTNPNQYLSKTQVYKKHNKEYSYNPLTTFYDDKFSYYTPEGNYFGRKSMAGTYLNLETQERGQVKGYFEEPFEHPKFKLLTNFTLLTTAIAGIGEALIVQMGKEKTTKTSPATLFAAGPTGGLISPILGPTGKEVSVETEQSIFDFPKYGEFINAFRTGTIGGPLKIGAKALVLALQTILVPVSLLLIAAQFADNLINIIRNFSSYEQYARQYNSECLYDTQLPVYKGNKRRKLKSQPFYLDNGIHSVGKFQINNGGRNSSIFIELEKTIPRLNGDDSRKTMSKFGITSKDNKQELISNSVLYYATLMKYNPNQYGTLASFKAVKIHTCPFEVILEVKNEQVSKYDSPNMFGGDCIIAEQTHINKFPIFRQNLTGTNFIDGTPYDYRLYNNVGFARYWLDSTDYDIGNIINIFGKTRPTTQKLPNSKFNLDLPNIKNNEWIERDQVFYTSVNGVIRYIAEVPYNITLRTDKEEGDGNKAFMPHYSDNNTDLSWIFRSDLQNKIENFGLNPSYKYLSQIYVYSRQLTKITKIDERENNTVLYSLPSSSDIGGVNTGGWKYFLPFNRFTFDRRDFGELTGIHALDRDRILFLFSKASPFISPGRSVLELKDQNIVIGDGGIFAQAPSEIMHTDVAYGSNHDRHAFVATQFGPFYVSEHQGKLFNFSGKLDEITRDGWQKWSAEFLPLQLKKQFPKWKGIHNPLHGVGYQIVFDNIFETIYFCKKDYYAFEGVTLNIKTQIFEYGGVPIKLGDPLYFENCSLTLSYAPGLQGFQSFHDWHPDAVIQEERHFSTVKNQTIWKHNIRLDEFNNYYGKDYPYQLGVIQSTGQTVTALDAIEYIQEAYKYKTSTLDRYAMKNETFDNAIISNAEQLSGMLKLNDGSNIRYEHLEFPKIHGTSYIDIPYVKVENKFRFNMFADFIKDRNSDKQPFITKRNGYDFIINQPALDLYQKDNVRFRHYWHTVWFSRLISGPIQFITKFINLKIKNSPR